ncbi:type II secretion system protein GspE [Peribacillus saganii]|uniref:Type II secretion system protein GspE n=1 Tax=Peribacillus saganii TaxID=2303992 RepID=A0A372LTN5_9BACI|nr:ATPase, T2SS/T4P/T4SS family [Peribacillus saganii]RFU71571.1 type II secretion system protein GspE [Peribacillus saganii]
MSIKRKRLGDLLVEAGIVTDEQLQDTLRLKKEGQKLGDALLERGFITEQQLIEVLEFQLGIPHISLFRYPIDASLLNLVEKEFAFRNKLIPLKKEGNQLVVAMNDPMDYFAQDDLRLATGFQISPVIATKDEILSALHKYYNAAETFEDLDVASLDDDDIDSEEAPAVRLVNQILAMGLQLRASDIHIDPHETKILIRYRVDGILRTERTLSRNIYSLMIARIKIMANLNITEARLPQDGRIKLEVNMKQVDLRISLLPTVYGEKVVIRILDLSNVMINLAQLGFNKVNLQKFVQMIERPSGMILLTGPTGSGKTSTLYAALNYLNTEKVNIVTIEDPVEYQLAGINQVQVNPAIGLDFASGLRSILRQDPNIVMIGEIRDKETADIAVRASLTGHLVFSTLHTNSALTTIPRLMDMDIEPYLVVSSLTGVVAQRLIRKICKECIETYEPTEMEKNLFQRRGMRAGKLYKGKGCQSCQNTGYRGRLAIHEVLEIDENIQSMMMNNKPINEIKNYVLRSGMIFLIDDGLLKAKNGLTTVEEVLRVALQE